MCMDERHRAALDVWSGLIAGIVDLLDDGSHLSCIPATRGLYLISGGLNSSVEPQVGHNDIPASKDAVYDTFSQLIGNALGGCMFVRSGTTTCFTRQRLLALWQISCGWNQYNYRPTTCFEGMVGFSMRKWNTLATTTSSITCIWFGGMCLSTTR